MANDLSPSVLKVVTALSAGQGLRVAKSVKDASTALYFASNYQQSQGNVDLASNISLARANLLALSNSIFSNGPIGFCTILTQVATHVKKSEDTKAAANFISNTSYNSYGTGITSISSMSTQGLETVVGNLTAAANAVRIIGPMFDFADIATVGTGVGFVKRLNQVKLGNYTGVNQELAKFGIDLHNIDDPIYNTIVDRVLENITNANILFTVADQFNLNVSINSSSVSYAEDLSYNSIPTPSATNQSTVVTSTKGLSEITINPATLLPTSAASASTVKGISETTTNLATNSGLATSSAIGDLYPLAPGIGGPPKPLRSGRVVQSLLDFINLNIIAPVGSVTGLKGNIVTIANKLQDMGAGFDSADSAAQMILSLATPSTAMLDASAPSLSAMVSNITAQLSATTGVGNGPLGTPNLTDFLLAVAGSPEIGNIAYTAVMTTNVMISSANVGDIITQFGSNGNATVTANIINVNSIPIKFNVDEEFNTDGNVANILIINGSNIASIPLAANANTSITSNVVSNLNVIVSNATALFGVAGIDLNNQPSLFGFTQYLSAATSIRTYGADPDNIGIDKILANMVTTDSSGESITSLMAEGKNNSTLQTVGIQPLKFGN